MKMSKELFDRLVIAITAQGLNLSEQEKIYLQAGNTLKRLRWDLFHMACKKDVALSRACYGVEGLNDSHIDTALRKIIS